MNPELVDATTLHTRSDRLEARGLLPHVVRRLLARTSGVSGLVMPAEEGIAAPGYDGRLDAGPGSAWVPAGPSVWEMGANQDPKAKAQTDYDTRTMTPGPVVPRDTVFVFVTSRRWADGQNWAGERRQENMWRDVVVLDAEALHGWLEETPDVHVWLSERLGLRPLTVRTLARAYDQLAARTQPPVPSALLLAGRREHADGLIAVLSGSPAATAVQAGSREEALAFIAVCLDDPARSARSQPLVIRDAEALERLALSERPLTLILSNAEGAEIGDAVARGHHVVLPLGSGDFATDDAIILDRPDRSAAREALVEAGVPFESADRYAGLARRSFAALLRAMAVTPGGTRPPWAAGQDAPLLAALLLLGGWSELEGDREVVAAVTGVDPAAVEAALLRHVGSDDPPWARSAGSWSLVSPDDSWTLLSHLLTEQLLQRWQNQAIAVLTEVDPRLGFDQGQNLLADLREEHHPRYSDRLRQGMAQAAALMGARGTQASSAGLVPARFSTAAVSRVLVEANADSGGSLWASLSRDLPMLAEAAPDVFLDAVADGLAREPSPLLAMFTDGPDSSPLLGPSSPHTGLLWALEGLAWSPQYVVRALLALGELVAREPGGRGGNRPTRSLRAILLPWHPQTSASPQGRLDALDALRERWPVVAWQLELTLLPRLHDSSTRSHVPQFRDWAAESEPVPADVDFEHIAELSARVGEDAGRDPQRWAQLIRLLSNIPTGPRDALLHQLEQLAPEAMEQRQRLALWRALVDEAERHLAMSDAVWSLGASYAKQLSTLAERFQDSDPPERHARLFDHRVRMPHIPRHDHEAQRQAVAAAQEAAALEVYQQGGLGHLVRLAEASRVPRSVGWAHAAASADADQDALLRCLGQPSAAAAMAAGWVSRRLADGGDQWLQERRAELKSLPPDGQAAFLLELPPTRSTWQLADTLEAEVQERYWRAARPYVLSAEDLGVGVERLLANGRPWAAVDVLSASVQDGGKVDVELADRALTVAASSEEVDVAVDAAFEVGQVLDAMERSGSEPARLAAHEFAFFTLLDHERAPRALSTAVAQDAGLFVDLVRHAHGRDDGADDPDVRHELSSHASHVLSGLHRLPGAGEHGLNLVALSAWATEARAKLAAAGRRDIGDECLGELLARGTPDEEDGIWPPRPVRDLLEELESEHVESGLESGHIKARGVTTRGVFDGGGQERGTAAQLRTNAATLDVRWPRSARVLRALAATYEDFAAREDRHAQHASDQN